MERLPENPGSVVQSTAQRDMQKEQGSAQSDGVNTHRKQNAFTMQLLQNVNNKSECSAWGWSCGKKDLRSKISADSQ